MSLSPKTLKAYAIRGVVPDEIEADAVFKIAQAFVKKFSPKNICLGSLRTKYFISEELSHRVRDVQGAIDGIKTQYAEGKVDMLDGLPVKYADWQLNLRPSNAEPLLRLSVEARSQALLDEKRDDRLGGLGHWCGTARFRCSERIPRSHRI